MILKMLTAAVAGYSCSKALYHRLHREGVPEMFRYAFGVMLVVLLGMLFFNKEDERENALKAMLLSAIGVGVGVGANRMLSD